MASAISFLLLTFGSAIGLSLTSPWPNAGARLWVVGLALAWWTVAVQIGSFAAGGYLAGRMRTRWGETSSDETAFRDNVHGALVWAVGVLLGAVALAMVAAGTTKTAVDAASTVGAGIASKNGTQGSSAAEYATDMLLRQPNAAPQPLGSESSSTSGGDARPEVNRIFLMAIKDQSLAERDRGYLVQLVSSRTGMSEADAQQRVNEAVRQASTLETQARAQTDKARKSAIVAGFITAASLLISLAVACLAAGLGGRHRDSNTVPLFSGHRFW